jgi:hypothetical protein
MRLVLRGGRFVVDDDDGLLWDHLSLLHSH